MSAGDEIIVSSFMQNIESVPDQARPPTSVNSSSWQRTAIAVVITALIFEASGYLLGLRTAQNPSQANREFTLRPSPLPTSVPSQQPSLMPFVPKTYYPVPTTNPVLTANWKTYMNEKYGFSFRYPQHLYVNTPPPCPPGYPCTADPDYRSIETYQRPPEASYGGLLPTLEYEVNGGGGYLHLYVYNTELNPSTIFKKIEGIAVGGKTGKIFIGDYHVLTPNDIDNIRAIDIPLNGKHIQLIYLKGDAAPTLDEFNQILSTFKFS